MESALSIAACGRSAQTQPCDGGASSRQSSSSSPAAAAPFVLVTDRLDTPGGAGAAVFDRAWSELADAVASGRAQASRVAVLALERPPALYARRGVGGPRPAASSSPLRQGHVVHVVDGYTDPFGWIGGGAADGDGAGSRENQAAQIRIDDLGSLARALVGASDAADAAPQPSSSSSSTIVVIDSLSALLARHSPLDVLRWLDAELLRSPRVSAVLALLHSDRGGGDEDDEEERQRGRGGRARAAATSGNNNNNEDDGDDNVSAAFEALASASLQLRPLTPAQRDLSGADGELRVVCRRRGAAAAGGAGGARDAVAAAVDSTRVFGGAGRPRAERLLYTVECSKAGGWEQEQAEGEEGPPHRRAASLARWLRAAVALAPMPREVAAPGARALAARAAERATTGSRVVAPRQQQQQPQPRKATAQVAGGGQRHDRRAAGGGGRAWAPLLGDEDNGGGGPAPNAPRQQPGRILFERDSGGSSAESGADPDEDLEI